MLKVSASQPNNVNIGATIIAAMRQLSIAPLPRNYELLYAAFTGTNDTLGQDLLELGATPGQTQLDHLFEIHVKPAENILDIQAACDTVARETETILALLGRDRASLESFRRILNTTAEGLRASNLTKEILQKVVSIISNATASTLEQQQKTFEGVADKTLELERVKSTLQEYKKLADTDALTQLWNRRAFDNALSDLHRTPGLFAASTLLLLDIDRFKSINDRFGHPAGDQVLKIVAQILQNHCAEMGLVARTGGEEFAILCHDLTIQKCTELAETIRLALQNAAFINPVNGMDLGRVTISIGLCGGRAAENLDDLYAKADRALYMSKMKGRNRVTLHDAQAGIAAPPAKDWMLYQTE